MCLLIGQRLLDVFPMLVDSGHCIFHLDVRYLGDGVFWEVLVGEVTGLDQLAGDRGVWRVRGLPIDA